MGCPQALGRRERPSTGRPMVVTGARRGPRRWGMPFADLPQPFLRSEALGHGSSSRRIDLALRRGELTRIAAGVYADHRPLGAASAVGKAPGPGASRGAHHARRHREPHQRGGTTRPSDAPSPTGTRDHDVARRQPHLRGRRLAAVPPRPDASRTHRHRQGPSLPRPDAHGRRLHAGHAPRRRAGRPGCRAPRRSGDRSRSLADAPAPATLARHHRGRPHHAPSATAAASHGSSRPAPG